MIKVYYKEWSGQNADAWLNDWAKINPLDHYRSISLYSRFLPLFEPYVRPGLRVLEAGCGLGGYLVHYRKQRVDIVGIDFSKQTVDWVKSVIPDCPILHGSVTEIPFPDQTFDTVISLGVLEHFEEGPAAALREARRVLRPGGTLLLDVPCYHLAFRLHERVHRLLGSARHHEHGGIASPSGRGWYKTVKRMEPEAIPDFSYYAYCKNEVISWIHENGFRVSSARGCSLEYGFRDFLIWLKLLRAGAEPESILPQAQNLPQPQTIAQIEVPCAASSSWLKAQFQDIFLRERGDTPFKRLIIGALRAFCPHLLFVVAQPRPTE